MQLMFYTHTRTIKWENVAFFFQFIQQIVISINLITNGYIPRKILKKLIIYFDHEKDH